MNRRRAEYVKARKLDEYRARKNAEKGRVALKLVSWNVNSYSQRAEDVETLFAQEEIDILFVCETFQRRFESGIILPLNFAGSVISMPAHKNLRGGRPSMGIAFLAKQKGLLRRESAQDGNKWQMLEVRHANVRLVGLYASPSASTNDWRDINAALKRLRAKGGPMIVCGDLNASHPLWSPSGKTRGGNALQELIKPLQRKEPHAAVREVAKRLPRGRGRQQREALFVLRAPRGVTPPFPAKNGTMAGSTIDLILISGWKGKLPPTPKIITSPPACASDHLPITMTFTLHNDLSGRAKEIFLPTPHRRNDEAVRAAAIQYNDRLPRLAAKLRACESKVAFFAHVDEMQTLIRKPWMLKVKPKPQRHTARWSATADSIAKWRSKIVRRALSVHGKAEDWMEKRRLDREIKRLVRARTHLRRQVVANNLRKTSSSLSIADVAARIEKVHAAADNASRLGDELKPRDFTEYFANKPTPKSLIALRKYTLPREMEKLFRKAIRKAKKGKAAGPDGVPMELLQICPAAFSELLFELFAAGARMRCVMKNWDFSILIPIYKKKGLIAVPANHRPLRLILSIRKIFEMGTTERLVRESPDEIQQYGFNEKSMALTPVALVVSAASLRYVLTILLDLIKAYDLVRRDQVMAIVDEEHSTETAGMVATLLQSSTVMTAGDETKLIKTVNVGLTQGGPASPALYKKAANVLIRRVLHALRIVDDGNCPAPLKAFADDIALQLTSDVAAAIALRAAGGWAADLLMRFNMEQGKSVELVESGKRQNVPRTLGGDALRGVHEDQYLGVGLSARGPTPGPVESRVNGASATLATLKLTKALVRGMAITTATEMHKAFLEAKWTYGCFFTPMTTTLRQKIDGLDAGFISATLTAVTLRRRRNSLPLARALLRMDSPDLVRKIRAHQFVAQINHTSDDTNLPNHVRERAEVARQELHAVPLLGRLVPDLENPWKPSDIRAAREDEWEKAFEGRKRRPPKAGRGKEKLPWGLRLLPPWSRALVARYFLVTFPIIEKRVTVAGKKKYLAAAKTPAEVKALRSLRMMHVEWSGQQNDLDEVRYALEILRGRGSRGRYDD